MKCDRISKFKNHIAFAVAAKRVDEACQALLKQGLTLEVPPKDYYWGRLRICVTWIGNGSRS